MAEQSVMLISKEGTEISITLPVAMESVTLRNQIEDAGNVPIPLENTEAQTIVDVFKYVKELIAKGELPVKKEAAAVPVVPTVPTVPTAAPTPAAVPPEAEKTEAKKQSELAPWKNEYFSSLMSGAVPAAAEGKTAYPVDKKRLFNFILGANYFDIKTALDDVCQFIANMIKGRTPEEIRFTFNIPEGEVTA
jgi:hypothetical protein